MKSPAFFVRSAGLLLLFLGITSEAQQAPATPPPSPPAPAPPASAEANAALREIRLIQRLQIVVHQQEDVIKAGSVALQVGANLLREAAAMSAKNEQLLYVLARHGYAVKPFPGGNAKQPPIMPRAKYVPGPIPLPGAEFPKPPEDLSAEAKADYDYLDGVRRKNLTRMRIVKENQATLEPLFADLTEMGKTDPDAKALVQKHNILRDGP